MANSKLTAGVSIATVIGVSWVLFTVALVLTVLRLWVTTRKLKQRLNLADGLLVTAFIWFLCENIFSAWTILNRPKNHNVDLEVVKIYEIVAVVYFYTFFVAMYAIKGSFLAFYYPMFARRGPGSRIAFWVVTAFDASCFVATMLLQTFICFPFKRFWELKDHCEPYYTKPYFIGVTVMQIVSDLTILFLPLFLFRQLRQAGGRERAGIAFVVSIGLISISASCVRFAVVWKVAEDFTVQHAQSTTTIELLFGLEWAAAYIAACLPAFRSWLRSGKKQEINGHDFQVQPKQKKGGRGLFSFGLSTNGDKRGDESADLEASREKEDMIEEGGSGVGAGSIPSGENHLRLAPTGDSDRPLNQRHDEYL